MPRCATVCRDLDAGHTAADVRRGAGDGHRLTLADARAAGRGGDHSGRRGVVAGGLGEHKAGLQRLRRHSHVREQVDHGLLHGRADRRREATIGGVLVRQSPRPHDRAGAKDQGSARRVAVKRKAVRCRAWTCRRPVVQQQRADVLSSSTTYRSTRLAGSHCRGRCPTRSRAGGSAFRRCRWQCWCLPRSAVATCWRGWRCCRASRNRPP